jgi:hypothetical protein
MRLMYAYVPVLHGVMHTSKRRWVRFVRSAVKLAEREERAAAVSGRHVRHGDAATGGRSYTLLRLSSGVNTGMVASTLARKGTDHATVLIIQPGYQVAGHAASQKPDTRTLRVQQAAAGTWVGIKAGRERGLLSLCTAASHARRKGYSTTLMDAACAGGVTNLL